MSSREKWGLFSALFLKFKGFVQLSENYRTFVPKIFEILKFEMRSIDYIESSISTKLNLEIINTNQMKKLTFLIPLQ